MKAKDLIHLLSKFPENSEVNVYHYDYYNGAISFYNIGMIIDDSMFGLDGEGDFTLLVTCEATSRIKRKGYEYKTRS